MQCRIAQEPVPTKALRRARRFACLLTSPSMDAHATLNACRMLRRAGGARSLCASGNLTYCALYFIFTDSARSTPRAEAGTGGDEEQNCVRHDERSKEQVRWYRLPVLDHNYHYQNGQDCRGNGFKLRIKSKKAPQDYQFKRDAS